MKINCMTEDSLNGLSLCGPSRPTLFWAPKERHFTCKQARSGSPWPSQRQPLPPPCLSELLPPKFLPLREPIFWGPRPNLTTTIRTWTPPPRTPPKSTASYGLQTSALALLASLEQVETTFAECSAQVLKVLCILCKFADFYL